MSLVELANPVTGRPMPLRAISCTLRSLSREREIACDSFSGVHPHHLELPHDRGAVEGVRRADPRDALRRAPSSFSALEDEPSGRCEVMFM